MLTYLFIKSLKEDRDIFDYISYDDLFFQFLLIPFILIVDIVFIFIQPIFYLVYRRIKVKHE